MISVNVIFRHSDTHSHMVKQRDVTADREQSIVKATYELLLKY